MPAPKPVVEPVVMSVAQVAEYIGRSRPWVYCRIEEGALPAFPLGRSLVIRRTEVDAMLERAARGQPLPIVPPPGVDQRRRKGQADGWKKP